MDRRKFLHRVIKSIFAGIGSALAVILGSPILSPSLAGRRQHWIAAARLTDLEDGVPTPVVARVVRPDGYYRAVDRQVVFVIKTGAAAVHALSSTCTHLGCRVSWDPANELLKCPCHGGVFTAAGDVVAGPPPHPLPRLATRVDSGTVFIQV